MIGIASIVLAIVSSLGVGAALNWGRITMMWKGKRLAIIGPRGVGKTHLSRYLSTGTIPETYKQTTASEKLSGRRFELRELNLVIKETTDVPGSVDAYGEWRELVATADLVLYLLRADRLIAGDTLAAIRVRSDLRNIAMWLAKRGEKQPKFFIVGTHVDLDKNFSRLGYVTDTYKGAFLKLPLVIELLKQVGGPEKVKVVLGNLKTKQGTERAVYEIFSMAQA